MNIHSASFVVALSFLPALESAANDAGPVDFQATIDAYVNECVKFGAPMAAAELPGEESEKCATLGTKMRAAVKGHLIVRRDGGSSDFLAEAERLWFLLGPTERDELLPAIKELTGPKQSDLAALAATEGLRDALNSKPGVGLGQVLDNPAVWGATPAGAVWGQSARRDDPRLAFTPPAADARPPKRQREYAPVPLMAFPEALKGNSWSDWGWWAGDVVREAGKRTAHSVASVLLMTLEGIGTGIPAGAGLASIALCAGLCRVGTAFEWDDLTRRGVRAADKGEDLLDGKWARLVDAVTRPVTVVCFSGKALAKEQGGVR